jgi:sugar transferase (PEP-CTERM/EpsH1 system associated)
MILLVRRGRRWKPSCARHWKPGDKGIRQAPLVAHVVFSFDVGGLENGVVNLINHMPYDAYRHVVIALTEITDFRRRIVRDDVQFIALNKAPGHTLWIYPRLLELFRKLRPAIVHSRNLAALEVVVPAWAAGVPVRIHGEHGRDVGDLDGSNRKYQWVRRCYRPFVTHYIALSRDLEHYLKATVGCSPARVAQIYNGVDTRRFHPATTRPPIAGCPFADPAVLAGGHRRPHAGGQGSDGSGRGFHPGTLAAFPELKSRLRLVMIGDGPLRAQAQALLERAGVGEPGMVARRAR